MKMSLLNFREYSCEQIIHRLGGIVGQSLIIGLRERHNEKQTNLRCLLGFEPLQYDTQVRGVADLLYIHGFLHSCEWQLAILFREE